MAQYATNAGPKQAQRLLFITISCFCEDFKNVNYEGNGNVLPENGAKPEVRYPLWRGRRFVPHTKGPVKTDKKISLSVDEKQPP